MKNILIIISLLTITACGAQKKYHKKLSIHAESAKFVTAFENLLGSKIDDLEVTFAELSQANVLGYCQTGKIVKTEATLNGAVEHIYQTPKVVLNTKFWNNLSTSAKEQLVFHELGHCILKRGHRTDLIQANQPASIMYPYHLYAEYYEGNYSNYIAELFSRPSFAISGISFDGGKYASTLTEVTEVSVDDVLEAELEDCVHDKGTVMEEIDHNEN